MKAIKGEKILERLSESRESIREVRLWKQVEAIWLKESLGWSGKEIAMVLGTTTMSFKKYEVTFVKIILLVIVSLFLCLFFWAEEPYVVIDTGGLLLMMSSLFVISYSSFLIIKYINNLSQHWKNLFHIFGLLIVIFVSEKVQICYLEDLWKFYGSGDKIFEGIYCYFSTNCPLR